MEWFLNYLMTLNASKCHLFVSFNKNESMFAKGGDELIWEESSATLLGITMIHR